MVDGNWTCFTLLFANDKRKAQNNDWRTPEKTLLLSMLLGGCMGGGMGMIWIRHKSQHVSFKIVLAVSVVLWTAALVGTMVYAAQQQ